MSNFIFNMIFVIFTTILMGTTTFSVPVPVPQAQQVQGVGNFLSQLLKDYVPKNTRQYTIINGNPPNLSSPIGRVGTVPVERSGLQKPQQLLSQSQGQPAGIMPSQAPSAIVTQDNWSPASSFSWFNPLGRSDFAYPSKLPVPQPLHQQQHHHQLNHFGHESQIITAEQIKNGQNAAETAEFQIQTQMGF